MLVGRVLRSPYAHANINKTIDTSIAKNLEGVEAVITYNYLPHIQFATYSICYSWSLDLSHRDVADRFILTYKARFVGDAVAAVIANDEIVAEKDVTRLIDAMSNDSSVSYRVTNPPDWKGGIHARCYITPKEVCWMPWKKRYDS